MKTVNEFIRKIKSRELGIKFITDKTIKLSLLNKSSETRKNYMVKHEEKIDFMVDVSNETDTVLNSNIISIKISDDDNTIVFMDSCKNEFLEWDMDTQEFRSAYDTHFYGLGQHQEGIYDYKGKEILLKHRNTVISMPFFLTDKGYGMLWNNNGRTTVRFDNDGRFSWNSYYGTEKIEFYLFTGSMKEIISEYWKLTGPAPLLPKWTYGFWQSKMRYESQQELLDVAEKYRKKRYPADIIVIDFYHWTEMGDFEFDKKHWPDPEGMFSRLEAMNFKCMVSVWPVISIKSRNHSDLSDKGFLIKANDGNSFVFELFNHDKGSLYDPFNKKARKAIWEKVKYYYQSGAKIWWLDACEPDVGEMENYKDIGLICHDGLLDERINAYPLMHHKSFYEGQRDSDFGQRILILSRSAFPGSQRYGVTVWSGDVGYDFNALRVQITAGLNATMSGLPFWTTDIGGFTGGDVNDPAYREVYLRWFQYAAFCPIFRAHGSRGAQSEDDLLFGISRGENEIWSFGPEAEEIMAFYLKLRYRLMPYIYSYAVDTLKSGSPLMRSLLLDFQHDTNVAVITDQFMFGKSIMVCPITKEARNREVYLPDGTTWYDFWSNEKFEGGQIITAKADLDRIPIYIKAGSIIPLAPPHEYTDQTYGNDISLHIYPGENTVFKFYDDDGKSYQYEQGNYLAFDIKWNDEDNTVVFDTSKGNYSEKLPINFRITVVNNHVPVNLLDKEKVRGTFCLTYLSSSLKIQHKESKGSQGNE